MDKSKPYRLKEPMLIATDQDVPYYMVPANTVLYHQKGFEEGHQLYVVEVLIKGDFAADRLAENASVEKTWLFSMNADEVSKVLNEYPLSKDDLVRILKARRMTREDLAQIVREWKDE